MNVKRALARHVERGEVLDLAGRTVPASLVRDVALGRLGPKPDPRGLRLTNAVIDGRLDLDNVVCSTHLELTNCEFPEGITAQDAQLRSLVLNESRFTHPSERAVNLRRLTASRIQLRNAVASGTADLGTLSLVGAHVGAVDLSGTLLRNDSGAALFADNLRVEGNLWLRDEFTAVATSPLGAVSVGGAVIGGQLDLGGARLRNDDGPALVADELRVVGTMAGRQLSARGTGPWAAVRLLNAHVGELELAGARVHNESGPAIAADGARIDGDLNLHGYAIIEGAGDIGALRLTGARVGGQVDLDGAMVSNTSGSAMEASMLTVGQALRLNGGFATASGAQVTVNLTAAQAGGRLVFTPGALTHDEDDHTRLRVDGLTYTGVPLGVSTEEWLRLLREATPEYAAQPYQQLATTLRAAGHDGEARRVLMAQRRDQIRRKALTGRAERAWARFTGFTLGYGYQPWRALLGLLLTVLIGVGSALVLGDTGLAGCTTVERIGYGMDLGTPLLNTRGRCAATDTSAGQALTVAGWGLGLAAWAFATLFVAGFTGAVRKTQ